MDDVGLLDQDEIAAELGLGDGDGLGGFGSAFNEDIASLEDIGAGGDATRASPRSSPTSTSRTTATATAVATATDVKSRRAPGDPGPAVVFGRIIRPERLDAMPQPRGRAQLLRAGRATPGTVRNGSA